MFRKCHKNVKNDWALVYRLIFVFHPQVIHFMFFSKQTNKQTPIWLGHAGVCTHTLEEIGDVEQQIPEEQRALSTAAVPCSQWQRRGSTGTEGQELELQQQRQQQREQSTAWRVCTTTQADDGEHSRAAWLMVCVCACVRETYTIEVCSSSGALFNLQVCDVFVCVLSVCVNCPASLIYMHSRGDSLLLLSSPAPLLLSSWKETHTLFPPTNEHKQTNVGSHAASFISGEKVFSQPASECGVTVGKTETVFYDWDLLHIWI